MPIISASAAATTSTYRPATAGVLKQRVARVVGAEFESPLVAAALEYLNDAIIEFNSRLYECNKIQSASITTTGKVGTLPAAFYKELECALVTSTGDRIRQLEYKDFAEFQHTFNFSTQNNALFYAGPYYYTLFNIYATGQIQLLPVVASTDTSTDYVKISYYKRFPLLLSDGDVLDAPQEIQRALILKAQAEMLRTHNPASPVVMQIEGLAEKAWAEFSHIDQRHPDQKSRFRLPPLTTRGWIPQGDGVIYIKI